MYLRYNWWLDVADHHSLLDATDQKHLTILDMESVLLQLPLMLSLTTKRHFLHRNLLLVAGLFFPAVEQLTKLNEGNKGVAQLFQNNA